MTFIPYGKQWIDSADIKAVSEVLKGEFITQGPKVEQFEKALCAYTGAKYCVIVSNGTAALHLAVLALEIKPGGTGITTPITFVASANALVYAGLKPVFADIDQKTYNLDPVELKKKVTGKTKVIIPVHFAGQSADMAAISKIAKINKLFVVEDAAHAIGSKYEDGSMIGNCKYSDLTTFSFHPVKTITTGEGGAITTNNKKLYEKLLLLRAHGITKDSAKLAQNPGPWYYEMQSLGFNYRMTDIQAALGLNQLGKLNKFVIWRHEIVKKYNEAFSKLPFATTPYEKKGLKSVFHLYILKIDFDGLGKSRTQVMRELKAKGVGTQVHYIPVYLQPYYKQNFGLKAGVCLKAEKYYEQCLTLPLYPKLTNKEVDLVIKSVKQVLK